MCKGLSCTNDLWYCAGGDGPKRVLLEEVREKHCLQERVTMLGGLHHSQVRDVSLHTASPSNPTTNDLGVL